jgi:hypothetical protein
MGKVFRYSQSGGITSKPQSNSANSSDEIHYRLRHINTGRLVIDQEILYNGIKLRTLGLSPHLLAKNLRDLSDK